MSGHSKWSKLKHTKGAKDQARGNLFAKLSRMIMLGVIEGGGITDPEHNVKLRIAIDHARSENLPKENIHKAIERGAGPEKNQLKEIMYEGFGPGGSALIIVGSTANANRTLSDVRNIMERHKGKLGVQGSVSYLFKKCGKIVFDKTGLNEEQLFNFAESVHAFDIDQDEALFTVYVPYEELGRIKDHLKDLVPQSVNVDYKPLMPITAAQEGDMHATLSLVNSLESLDDVHKVYLNYE